MNHTENTKLGGGREECFAGWCTVWQFDDAGRFMPPFWAAMWRKQLEEKRNAKKKKKKYHVGFQTWDSQNEKYARRNKTGRQNGSIT